ncbi:zinc-ribbon domain-containing protein [Rathayibacter sp. VKM Ac-2803]|uniref:zinc-ribbon domain-containing protein n=1 Tax=unclassified Rathayibacter TaxID=2609250 RepID=UPI00135C0D18|nr:MULTISPECIES: zinc-ribbon domain-containing protein [unclassified Rathayibacter]MWV48052.1 zinc-ribbon domain-containing protein [Rathayibacter sp. VKM Ac-2803]MWV58726.1 zinc-ribbon domain-containing protein [Rathayibacter sp. VKM Ac-2754]
MLLIFGTRSVEDLLRVVVLVCGFCGVRDEQRVLRSRTRLALFFVPLLTISTRYLLECANCGTVSSLSKEEAEGGLAEQSAPPSQPARPQDARPDDGRPRDA